MSSVIYGSFGNGLTRGTSVATTSGTAIDFIGIPNWVKRITVMLNGVSTNGTSDTLIQIGTSGGVETSGYIGVISLLDGAPTYGAQTLSTGIRLIYGVAAANSISGHLVLTLISENIWIFSGSISTAGGVRAGFVSGSKLLSTTLDRVRLTTANGTDTFDAGSINILYE